MDNHFAHLIDSRVRLLVITLCELESTHCDYVGVYSAVLFPCSVAAVLSEEATCEIKRSLSGVEEIIFSVCRYLVLGKMLALTSLQYRPILSKISTHFGNYYWIRIALCDSRNDDSVRWCRALNEEAFVSEY